MWIGTGRVGGLGLVWFVGLDIMAISENYASHFNKLIAHKKSRKMLLKSKKIKLS